MFLEISNLKDVNKHHSKGFCGQISLGNGGLNKDKPASLLRLSLRLYSEYVHCKAPGKVHSVLQTSRVPDHLF